MWCPCAVQTFMDNDQFQSHTPLRIRSSEPRSDPLPNMARDTGYRLRLGDDAERPGARGHDLDASGNGQSVQSEYWLVSRPPRISQSPNRRRAGLGWYQCDPSPSHFPYGSASFRRTPKPLPLLASTTGSRTRNRPTDAPAPASSGADSGRSCTRNSSRPAKAGALANSCQCR